MRIFWHRDALQIVPEDERERDLLRAIAGCSAGKQADVHLRMSEREAPTGNRWFQFQPAAKQSSRGDSPNKRANKEKIVSINEAPKP